MKTSCELPLSGFEGPEKKLEIRFRPLAHITTDSSKGLRAISVSRWQEILDNVKCTIISYTPTPHMDTYVLSESSLFVYPNMVMIKTCGTTTLLRCLGEMINVGRQCGLAVEFVSYSRKNFVFPNLQPHPHNSFEAEVHYLDKLFPGKGFTFGDPNKDHWHKYVADLRDDSTSACHVSPSTFEVMMHDLDPAVLAQFYKREGVSAYTLSATSGITSLLPPCAMIDPFQFEPCGYSMNGASAGYYYTIHITPEEHCSYVSFETNAPSSVNSYASLLREVVEIFRPGRITAVSTSHSSSAGTGALRLVDGYFSEGQFYGNFAGEEVLVHNMIRGQGGKWLGKRFLWDTTLPRGTKEIEGGDDYSDPEVEDGRSEGDCEEENEAEVAMQ